MKFIFLFLLFTLSAPLLASVEIKVNVVEVTQYSVAEEKVLSRIRFNVRLCQSVFPGDFVAVVEQRPDLQLLTIQEAVGVECTGPLGTQEFEITTDQLLANKPVRIMNLLSVETVQQ